MFKIGYRILKTAIGCGAAIGIAQFLGLHFYISAGIITILNIKPTKKASFQSAGQRFVACVIGIVFAAVFFKFLPHHPLTITILLLVFIPTLVKIKLEEGIITSIVIILQLYTSKDITWGELGNELTVITIGVGVSLLLNSYMPSLDRTIEGYRKKIDQNFAAMLREFAAYLLERNSDWDGKEIIETGDILKEARLLAVKEIENRLIRQKNSYYAYFKMRDDQFDILKRLLPIISSLDLDETYDQGKQIGDFLLRLSEKVSPINTADQFLEELQSMRETFRESPLPKDRHEFEVRSALLHFTNEMQRYLQLKSQLGMPYAKTNGTIKRNIAKKSI